jgi:hypothetical protein
MPFSIMCYMGLGVQIDLAQETKYQVTQQMLFSLIQLSTSHRSPCPNQGLEDDLTITHIKLMHSPPHFSKI